MRRYYPRLLLIIVMLAGFIPFHAGAEEVQLRPDHPERYVVVKGDTLWDISVRFLKSPWHWPKIWRVNESIKNPHLIYPGDVIALRWVNGQPQLTLVRGDEPPVAILPPAPTKDPRPTPSQVVKLEPRLRTTAIEGAIPTIAPNLIVPFLTQPLAVDEDELADAGYITIGLDDRIALGDHSEFYARGLKGDGEYFQIFRQGRPIRNPDTGELLAYEAIYLGDADRLESGDPSKMVVTTVKQEILPTDRLLAAPPHASLPYYFPHAPTKRVEGHIVSALNAVAELGPYTIVSLSLGRREGMEEGHVLRVMRHVGTRKDPVTRSRYALPDEESALVLVFRIYEKMSYAVVLNATRPVHILDRVVTP